MLAQVTASQMDGEGETQKTGRLISRLAKPPRHGREKGGGAARQEKGHKGDMGVHPKVDRS